MSNPQFQDGPVNSDEGFDQTDRDLFLKELTTPDIAVIGDAIRSGSSVGQMLLNELSSSSEGTRVLLRAGFFLK